MDLGKLSPLVQKARTKAANSPEAQTQGLSLIEEMESK